MPKQYVITDINLKEISGINFDRAAIQNPNSTLKIFGFTILVNPIELSVRSKIHLYERGLINFER